MSKEIKPKRRDFLFTATYTIGAVGLGAAIWPLVDQMNPDASVKALSTTEVDVSGIEPGKSITVLWRGKPIFIKRRTATEIQEAKNVDLKDLPDPDIPKTPFDLLTNSNKSRQTLVSSISNGLPIQIWRSSSDPKMD